MFIYRNIALLNEKGIGDRPVGAGGAAATPDKEHKLSTRNQKLMKKQFHTRKSVHDA